jgi:hypothetical protein
VGWISVTLDEKRSTLDLTRQQRAAGALFNRFGISNIRTGGKLVTLNFDDLTYTARRPKDYERSQNAQDILVVPFPEGGRKY